MESFQGQPGPTQPTTPTSTATRPESQDVTPFQAPANDPSTVVQMIDCHRITIEGFRSLGILATFFAGLQAQMLSVSFSDNSTTASRLVNAFWIAGVILDVFGAVLATLTARWFEVLDARHVEFLDKTWSADPTTLPQHNSERVFIDTVIANALFSGLPIVACGVILFLIGLIIRVWAKQPLVVSIISTIPFAVLAPLVAVVFYPHSTRKNNIIQILKHKRGEW